MQIGDTREVNYHKFCSTCENAKKSENDDPCFDCLTQGWNYHSEKPINYKPKE